MDFKIRVINVKSTYINSDIPEDQDAYVKQPSGYVVAGKEHLVWKLKKALYGLKQSGFLWYETLRSTMLALSFTVCDSDPCVFVRHSPETCIVSSHVDDLTIYAKTKKSGTDLFKKQFEKRHKITDNGDIHQLLAMAITRNRQARTISFSQTAYIEEITERFRMKDSNPSSYPTPSAPGQKLSSDDCPSTPEERAKMVNVPYQALVGSLMYVATHTRPAGRCPGHSRISSIHG